MAKISEFYGITIEMSPNKDYLSHVIANFGDRQAMFSARSGVIMDMDEEFPFPEKQSQLVTAWILLHQKEIQEIWEKSLADGNYKMKSIAPLQ